VMAPQNLEMHQDRPFSSFVQDITDDGFNPATDTITSAKIIIDVHDDSTSDPVEYANFKFDGADYGTFDVDFANLIFNLSLSLLTGGHLDAVAQRRQRAVQSGKSTLLVDVDRSLLRL